MTPGGSKVRCIAALDQGTTSTRFVLFDHRGRRVASAQKEHRQIYPQPGWVEQDPLEIWHNCVELIEGVMAAHGVAPGEVGALGVTNQRETTVVWDRDTGAPFGNAIGWQDTRTAPLCAALAVDPGHGAFRERTGLPIATYFSGPKLRWILDHVPAAALAAAQGRAAFGTVDSWLIWNLTGGPRGGVHITDPTNASRTLLYNLHTLAWDPQLLAWLGVPTGMLAQVGPSSAPNGYGQVQLEALRGVPICGDLGDQQAALFGQTCFAAGEAKNTYGTGCFLLLNTGEKAVPSSRGLLTTVAYQLGTEPPRYALEGSIAVAGSLVQWARDQLGLFASAEELNDFAARVPDNGGVYLVPAFSGLFAPHWRPDARGIIAGLTHFATKAHLARAILEATAYQTREIFAAMAQDSRVALRALKVDGGMTASGLLMQFQADMLAVPVLKPSETETTALGAAYAAGLAVGFWPGTEDLRANWVPAARWEPRMAATTREQLFAGWQKAVEKSLDWEG